MASKTDVWDHLDAENGDTMLALRNIVCHLDFLLTDEQKAAINWHPQQSVSLAVMRVISDLNKPVQAEVSSSATPPEGCYESQPGLYHIERRKGAASPATPALKQQFPIRNVGLIPWSVAERAYQHYSSLYGTEQSLQRMAERGGFGLSELGWHLQGKRARPGSPQETDAACEFATREILKALADVARLPASQEEKK